jgi:hypothetical protein
MKLKHELGKIALAAAIAIFPLVAFGQQVVRSGSSIAGGATEATMLDILAALTASAANDVAHDAADAGFPVKIGCRADTTTPASVADGDRANIQCNERGEVATYANAHTVGGCTPASVISAGAVLETEVKASAGQLYKLSVTSLDATPVYIRLYNDTSAGLDEASDTPVLRYGVPAAPASDLAGREIPIPATGMVFSTGIIFRVTTGIADSNTGALTANEVLVSYCYK